MTTQYWLWAGAGAAFAFALAAGFAESRRHRRVRLDRPGWVPWRGLQVAAFFLAVVLAVLAPRIG